MTRIDSGGAGGEGPVDEQQLRSSVRALVLELAPHPAAAPSAGARLVEDLGFHSLALLELSLTLEDEFGLPRITQAVARHIRTLGAVEDHVVGVLIPGGPAGVSTSARGHAGVGPAPEATDG